MAPFRQRLHHWLLFPFLLPVFFVLHRTRTFFGVVDTGDAAVMTGLYLLMALVVYRMLRPFSGFALRGGIATVLLMGCFFYWGEITTAVARRIPGFTLVHLPWVVLGMLLLVWGCWYGIGKAGPHNRARFCFFGNALLLIYIVVEGGQLGWLALHRPPAPAFTQKYYEQEQRMIRQKPSLNVYLLLFDEYASSASLRQDWGFDNAALDSLLQQQGFSIQHASRANYNLTQFSMASLLNMDYLPLSPDGTISPMDYQQAARWIDGNRVVADFRQAGYRFSNCSIFRVGDQPEAGLPEFVHLDGKKLIAANTFAETFRKDYLPFLQRRRHGKAAWHPGEDSAALFAYDAFNRRMEDSVLHGAGVTGPPRFVYAHFVLPHLPFLYDSLGRLLPEDTVRAADARLDPVYYGYNVRQANRMIRKLVTGILSREQGKAVILLLGDHGFRKEEPGKRAALFANLNAVYFPDGDYRLLHDSMSNVNLLRTVLNKYLGTQYAPLPDRTVYIRNR